MPALRISAVCSVRRSGEVTISCARMLPLSPSESKGLQPSTPCAISAARVLRAWRRPLSVREGSRRVHSEEVLCSASPCLHQGYHPNTLAVSLIYGTTREYTRMTDHTRAKMLSEYLTNHTSFENLVDSGRLDCKYETGPESGEEKPSETLTFSTCILRRNAIHHGS